MSQLWDESDAAKTINLPNENSRVVEKNKTVWFHDWTFKLSFSPDSFGSDGNNMSMDIMTKTN
jgi:hypothetical protein